MTRTDDPDGDGTLPVIDNDWTRIDDVTTVIDSDWTRTVDMGYDAEKVITDSLRTVHADSWPDVRTREPATTDVVIVPSVFDAMDEPPLV